MRKAGWHFDPGETEPGLEPMKYWTRLRRPGDRRITYRAKCGFVVPAGVFVYSAKLALAYDRGDELRPTALQLRGGT